MAVLASYSGLSGYVSSVCPASSKTSFARKHLKHDSGVHIATELYAVCALTNIGLHPLRIEKPSCDYSVA